MSSFFDGLIDDGHSRCGCTLFQGLLLPLIQVVMRESCSRFVEQSRRKYAVSSLRLLLLRIPCRLVHNVDVLFSSCQFLQYQ